MAIKHNFVSTQPNSSNSSLVSSNAWNDGHVIDSGGITFNDGSVQTLGISSVSLSLSSSVLKTLKTTPVQVIPAPGVGKGLFPFMTALDYTFGTVPFGTIDGITNSFVMFWFNPSPFTGNLNDYYWMTGGQLGLQSTIGSDTTESTFFGLVPLDSAIQAFRVPTAIAKNAPVYISHDNSVELTTGDGNVTFTVYYVTVPII